MVKTKNFDFESILSNKKASFDGFEKKTSVLDEVNKFDEINSLLSKENRISTELKTQMGFVDDGQVLIYCDPLNNHNVLISTIKSVVENKKKPIIVLTSMNYKTALKLIDESKLSGRDFFLIDTISKNIINVSNEKNLKFVDSLRNLTQMQIFILKLIESEKDLVLIFDSLDVLGLYHNEKIIFKFIYSLTRLCHKNKLSGYYITSKKTLVPKLSQFFDNLAELEKID